MSGSTAHRLLMLALLVIGLLPLPVDRFAFVPAYAFGIAGFDGPLNIAAALRGLAGHMWVHAGATHLLGNVAALALFGPPLAAVLGGRRFWLFFIIAAALAALAEAAVTGDRLMPLVGASGGISAVAGAVIGHWRRVRLDLPLPGTLPTISLPLTLLVALELLANVAMAILPATELGPLYDQVAWGAHLGGFAAGWASMALLFPWRGGKGTGGRRLTLRVSSGFAVADPVGNALTVAVWAAAVWVAAAWAR